MKLLPVSAGGISTLPPSFLSSFPSVYVSCSRLTADVRNHSNRSWVKGYRLPKVCVCEHNCGKSHPFADERGKKKKKPKSKYKLNLAKQYKCFRNQINN